LFAEVLPEGEPKFPLRRAFGAEPPPGRCLFREDAKVNDMLSTRRKWVNTFNIAVFLYVVIPESIVGNPAIAVTYEHINSRT
jgi:hypothetical protein